MSARVDTWLKRIASLKPEFEVMGWVIAMRDEPTLAVTPEFMAFVNANRPYFADKANGPIVQAIGSPLQHNAHCQTLNDTMDIKRITRAYCKTKDLVVAELPNADALYLLQLMGVSL